MIFLFFLYLSRNYLKLRAMKKITFLFLNFLLFGSFFSCKTDNAGEIKETIHFDTTYLSCDQGMETAILLNDTLYVFSPRVSSSLGQSDTVQKMYCFNKQGEKLFEIVLDSLFHNYYYLFPANNQLYASVRLNNEDATLRFDPSLHKWIPAEGVKPAPLFEDENYIVTSSSSGEWGGTIFFTSKQDGKTYEGASLSPIQVMGKNGVYYISNALEHMSGHSTICAIEDPLKMAVFKNDRPTADSLIHLRESTSTQGLKMIADYGAYKKPTGQFTEPAGDTVYVMQPAMLLSSFIHKNDLYYMYADTAVHIFRINPTSESTVTDIQDPRVEILYTFTTPMSASPWLKYSQTNYHQLFFLTGEGGAIMEVVPDAIYLHTLVNKK